MTRSGSVVPLWMATTSTMGAGLGTRAPVTVCEGVTTERQPPQSRPICSNRACAKVRAAPMPRFGDAVSERVWRVPKPTKASIVAFSCAASGAVATSRSSGCSGDAAPAVVTTVASANTITPLDLILMNLHLKLGAGKSAGVQVSLREGYINNMFQLTRQD